MDVIALIIFKNCRYKLRKKIFVYWFKTSLKFHFTIEIIINILWEQYFAIAVIENKTISKPNYSNFCY